MSYQRIERKENMWEMIKYAVLSSLLFLGGTGTNAYSISAKEWELNYLWLFDMKIKLLNDHADMLKRSVTSYIPYHEEDSIIKKPGWMYNIYLSMLEKHERKYDMFYACVSESEQCDFLFIKDNVAFLCSPYLKIPGSEEKIDNFGELKCLIDEVEENLFQEENPQKAMELVRRLHSLKEAACAEENYSKQLPKEIVQSILNIVRTFRGLQSEDMCLNGYELTAIYDYMWDGESQELWYYGLDSSLFGATIKHRTAPGSPAIYVATIFDDLIRYVKSKPAHEQVALDWLKEEMKELPFVRDCH